MQKAVTTIQIGKQGVSSNFIDSLKNQFKSRKNIRVSVLKSARGEGKEAKTKVREFADKILNELGDKYTARVIGFTIILKKWRKAKR